MRMRRKLKTYVKIILSLFIVLAISLILLLIFSKPKEKEKKVEKINYVELIIKLENNMLYEKFLYWLENNYKEEVMESLYTNLKDGTYDNSFWHKETGNSYIVLQDLYLNMYENRNDLKYVEGNKESVSIGFAGDVSLADNWAIMPKYVSRNKGV